MRDYSAAFLALVMGTVKALLTPARGRHAAARRRRSTRVRRYAPLPAVESARKQELRTPRLARPSETLPADDVALVRPSYLVQERRRARERDLDRIQAQANARLQAWIPQQRSAPSTPGDLLAAPSAPVFTAPSARVRVGAAV
ncbi:hypothetical protein [Nocardiopsis sp. NRRL B-16309]|uniref:hypothetical protein n=1 Tax=Nocardiopsis sp. NRRL B-16309 TaxID=1519494 RepID=UPI0006AF9CE0|nr:hypothetical protein [Nocardiopsis sp. NRRL B-16309]KOX20831.1 hypothetical protein ADL05_05170 [Nocardiopsis sp. NRRL B-16309]